ncbi:MAG: Dam family site-specific DNA-(adenine-N6)-methyltransferase [Dysgonamonadaceae bacterium]|jgi:DNA adenine methylase|nr:Dam family site-specific DNA-(adenine-N6)-methyltransferase [Dysgonamonadaceae bacterium]
MEEFNDPKPFIKWAGGKDKLYSQLEQWLPFNITKGDFKNYYEPFLGSGAVFFNLAKKVSFDNVVLSDINEELILVYKVVQRDVSELMELLDQYKNRYSKLSDIDKEKFYYDMRFSYNNQRFNINHKKYSELWISRAAQMVFLNKTCYNGLYRQNMRGEFNVPFGKNYHPSIYDQKNIELVSKLLNRVEIKSSDFSSILDNVLNNSFVYLDPPYRPISKTSNFTDYYKLGFTEKDNNRLMEKLNLLNRQNVKFMLNNSFPLNDEYLKKYYANYSVNLITANRMMSGISSKRGKVSEIVITNY